MVVGLEPGGKFEEYGTVLSYMETIASCNIRKRYRSSLSLAVSHGARKSDASFLEAISKRMFFYYISLSRCFLIARERSHQWVVYINTWSVQVL